MSKAQAFHSHGPVDVHAHWYPKRFLDLLAEKGPAHGLEWREIDDKGPQFKVGYLTTGPLGPRFVDLDARLAAMDEQGVKVHALSLSQPMVYWAGRELGERLAATFNEELARAHERAPRRLVGLAALPMHEPDLAVKEVERAAKLPGVRGFYMSTRVNDRELSEPAFFPVYERIEALGLPIFLHPVFVIANERLQKHYLTNLLGNPFESAIAAAHLIFGGVLDRYPQLTVVLPHAGGAFPWLVGRLSRGWEKRADLKSTSRQSPVEYLRRFYYDTVGYSDDVLDYLVRVIGADRVLMGSDYCFPIAYERPVEIVTAHSKLDEAAKHAITEVNAARLLGL
ncbi:MAG: amidohydrolase family protein [Betaproteobacteria bacterium]|jgi:aminocarboxymuconate-semialdehyde decarboxylase|nr:amidohydrolase family protein [Betaproteobacteria bacterium]